MARSIKMLVLLGAAASLLALAAASSADARACRGADTLPKVGKPGVAARATVCLINGRRQQHGLQKLDSNAQLNSAGVDHSSYMDKHSCFSHQCPGEPDLMHRLLRANYLTQRYKRWEYGEDIAWGAAALGTPKEIVKAWMHSPEHRANILDRSFRNVGVGVVWGTPQSSEGAGGLYTADFGFRRG